MRARLLVVLFIVLAAALPPALGLARPRAADGEATLTVLAARVTVIGAADGAAWTGSSVDTLRVGDRVLTDATGRALLTFADGSEQELGAATEVRIAALGRTAGGGLLVVVAQAAGTSVNRVAPQAADASYQLQTPSATALVRGTVFGARVERAGDGHVTGEEIAVQRGAVEVRTGAGERMVHQGERLRIAPADGGGNAAGQQPPAPPLLIVEAAPTPAGATAVAPPPAAPAGTPDGFACAAGQTTPCP